MAVLLALGTGCGAEKPACRQPEAVQLVIRAAPNLNVDERGSSLPTVVRWFQLESAEQALLAGFNDVWQPLEGGESALGPVVASEEFQTFPGQHQKVSVPLKPQTKYLFVAAMFRKPSAQQWREILVVGGDGNKLSCPKGDVLLLLRGSQFWTPETELRVAGSHAPPPSAGKRAAAAKVTDKTPQTRVDPQLGLRFDAEQTRWDELLVRHIPRDELGVFHLSYMANSSVESGERATFSGLHTTAGADMRASYGRGQLTIEAHLDQLAALTPAELQKLGVEGLSEMRKRGKATYEWFRLMQGRPISAAERKSIGISARLAGNLASLIRDEAWVTIASQYGPIFEQSTGIEGAAVLDMARTMLLDRREYRVLFRDRYQKLHGEPFQPGRRDRNRMAAAAEAVVRVEPRLAPVLRSLGSSKQGAHSLGHYLGVGDFSENVHGWYTRAAQTVVGWPKFVQMLEEIDEITTRMRHARDLSIALDAVSATELTGLPRAKLAARIARQFHGAPGTARAWFFRNGDPERPKYTTASALERALSELTVDVREREWSDTRLARALDAIIKKRSVRTPAGR